VLNGDARPGDNTWTNSIVALHPETGKLEWGFQTTPHDTHDWDAAEVPVLVDGLFDGVQRKMMLQAARNGYFFVLDRANGTNLKTIPFAAANWATGSTKPAARFRIRDKEPSRDGRLVAPNEAGGTNYRSPSFDPDTACSSSARRTATGSISSSRSTVTTDGRAPTTTSTAAASCGRFDYRTATLAGATSSATARRRPAC
jgi:alcohol dehydrogenase (cytochrome c)